MDINDEDTLSPLLRRPTHVDAGLETSRLRGAARSALFGGDATDIRIGRFILGPCIGKGGMGTVFRARDPDLGRDVALKIFDPIDRGERATHALLREARTLAKLNHPNVVTIHECGVDQDRVYIAMEYVDGGTLVDWLRHHPPNEAGWFHRAVHLAIQAARGLTAAHASGLIHRDLKPSNMLVDADDRLRVADFGLARQSTLHQATFSERQGTSEASAWTSPAGTPAYVAPEQLEGRPTEASDQFSLCASLYEMFAGTVPFKAPTSLERVGSIRDGRFERPSPDHHVPRWLRRTLERGLCMEPADRFPSMPALLSALERGRGRRARRAVLALGSLGLGAAAIVALQSFRPEPSPLAAAPCTEGPDRIEEVWSPRRAQRARASVLGAEGAYSRHAWPKISERLETWSEQWVHAYRSACEATKVHGTHSVGTMELTMRCLDRGLVGVDATLDRLGTSSLDAVVAALVDVRPPIECRDTQRLETRLSEPDGTHARTQVLEIARALQTSKISYRDGAPEDAIESSTRAVERARALGHGPTLAEALTWHATLLAFNSRPFEHDAREAVQTAALHDIPELEVEAWLTVSRATADQQDVRKRNSDTSVAIEAAQAALSRAGSPPWLAALVAQRRAETAHWINSDLEQAAEHYARALALFRSAPETSVTDVGMIGDNYGQLLRSLGRHEDALELGRWRSRYVESQLGARHPATGRARERVAEYLIGLGSLEEAQREAGQALEIYVQSNAADGNIAYVHGILGEIAMQRDDWDRARGHIEAKLELYEEIYDGKGMVPSPLADLGMLELLTGNPQRAKQHLERALAITIESHGPTSPWVGSLQGGLSEATFELGEFEETIELCALSISDLKNVHGPKTPRALRAMARVVQAHLGLGDVGAARVQLSEIDEIEADAGDMGLETTVDVELARAMFELKTGALQSARARIERLQTLMSLDEEGPSGEQLERAHQLRRVLAWTKRNL